MARIVGSVPYRNMCKFSCFHIHLSLVTDPRVRTFQAAITRRSSSSMSSSRTSSTIGAWSTFFVFRVSWRDGLLMFPVYSLARPDVRFFCDLDFDPFLIMQDQKKVYGKVESPVSLYGRGSVNLASFRFHNLVVRIRSNDSDPMGRCKRCGRLLTNIVFQKIFSPPIRVA